LARPSDWPLREEQNDQFGAVAGFDSLVATSAHGMTRAPPPGPDNTISKSLSECGAVSDTS